MKVVFTGTTSSGKTTLLNALKQKNFPHVVCISEIADSVLRQQPGIEKTPEFQDLLFSKQVMAEQEAERSGAEVVFCDRSIIDNIAHALLFQHPVKQEWVDWCHTYSYVYIFNKDDIQFKVTELQKSLDKRNWYQFREQLHYLIIQTTIDCFIPYEFLTGTVEARLKTVEDKLLQYLNDHEVNKLKRKER